MTDRKLVSAFACGLFVGLAVAFVASISGWFPWMNPRVPPPILDADSFLRGQVRVNDYEAGPQVHVQLDPALDPTDAEILGSPRDSTREVDFEVMRVETKPGLVAYKAWEGNGFSGYMASLCFGPELKDVRVRVGSFADIGPPYPQPWQYVDARIRLSQWPPDRPGTVIAFDLEGQQRERALMFAGKFRVPP